MGKPEHSRFNPGDCVTVIIRDSDGNGIRMESGMFVAEAEGYVVLSRYGKEYSGLREAMQWAKYCTGAYGYSGLWAYPAADCYADKWDAETQLCREGPSLEQQLAALFHEEETEDSGLLEDD